MLKILIVGALYEELKPLMDKLGVFSIKKLPNNDEYYYLQTEISEKKLEIYATFPPDYSKVECACHTSRMMSQIGANIALMTGICAGDDRKVELGDIIVSKKIIDYETGKQKGGIFLPEIKSFEVANELKQFLSRFVFENPKILVDEKEVNVHFDTIATGTKVIEQDDIFKTLELQDRKVIGLDMEAYAFVKAVYGVNKDCYTFVVKSVCDYANRAKNDDVHSLSTKASAEWIYRFLEKFLNENNFADNLDIKHQVKYESYLNFPALTNSDRKEWFKVIKWNDEFEEFYNDMLQYSENDSSGMSFYPIGNDTFILETLLAMHAYQASYAYSIVNLKDGVVQSKILSFQIPYLEENDNEVSSFESNDILCGYPVFDSNTMELELYHKFRGIGDGVSCTYRLEQNGSTQLTRLVVNLFNEESLENEDADIFLEPTNIDLKKFDKKLLRVDIQN